MPTKDSQEEFLTLVQANQGIIHKICSVYTFNPNDHQDLYQEIIIQLWKSFPAFRGDSKFSTWLYRIALNTAISDLRRQKRKVPVVYTESAPGPIADQPDSSDYEDQLKQLYKAISQLGEIERAMVMLYLEDKSYEEMEDILGISQNNLRVKMNRVKEKLRKLTKAVEYGTR